MIEHVVLFAVTPGTDSEQVDEMVAAVRELPSRIPGIVSVSIGQNFNNRGKNYTHGLVVRLESSEALDTYLEHPAHVEVVEDKIRPIVDDVLALDWVVTD